LSEEAKAEETTPSQSEEHTSGKSESVQPSEETGEVKTDSEAERNFRQRFTRFLAETRTKSEDKDEEPSTGSKPSE